MKILKYSLLIITIITCSVKSYGQLNPMGSMYYLNPYLANPAMAGIEKGWELNGAYKAQWTAIENAPAMQAITATYGSENKKVGFGINLYNEGAGVIRRTSGKLTYAFHLPLNSEDNFIDFGLSAGITDEWVDFNKVRGDITDPSLYNFNQRKVYFDGDFGVAYRKRNLTVQGVMPNLKLLFDRDLKRQVADRYFYMVSVGYKFINDENSALSSWEPRVAYRGVQNYKDIVDIGVNTQFFGNKLLLSGIYHTTNSVTIGAGTTFKNQLSVLCQYTSNTSDLGSYSNSEFEIGLKYNFR